jgi:hypothetical protein
MAVVIYMIVAAFLVLLLGVPVLFIALSFDSTRARRPCRVPVPSAPSLPQLGALSSERAAA